MWSYIQTACCSPEPAMIRASRGIAWARCLKLDYGSWMLEKGDLDRNTLTPVRKYSEDASAWGNEITQNGCFPPLCKGIKLITIQGILRNMCCKFLSKCVSNSTFLLLFPEAKLFLFFFQISVSVRSALVSVILVDWDFLPQNHGERRGRSE